MSETNKSLVTVNWAGRALAVSHATELDAKDPVQGMEAIALFAKDLARESARREAMGEDLNLVGSRSVNLNFLFQEQLVALGKQTLSYVRAGGYLPKGEALGTFNALVDQMDFHSKAAVLWHDPELARVNPEWAQAVLAMAVAAKVTEPGEIDIYSQSVTQRPIEAPSAYESAMLAKMADSHLKFSHAAMSAADNEGLGNHEVTAMEVKALARQIAEFKMLASEREVATGRGWVDQGFTSEFKNRSDAHLRAMATSFVSMVNQAGISPKSDPSIAAAYGALCALMTRDAATFLTAQSTYPGFIPQQGNLWREVANATTTKLEAKWVAGVARPANAPYQERTAEPIRPVESEMVKEREKAVGLPMIAMPKNGTALTALGVFAGDALYQGGFALGQLVKASAKAFGAVAGFTRGLDAENLKHHVGSAIDKANVFTDQVEERLKDSMARAYQASSEALFTGAKKLDGAIASAAHAASDARKGFKGVVGEAKYGVQEVAMGARDAGAKALGLFALQAADALPSAQTMAEGGLTQQKWAMRAAGIAGALFIGVVMAPVAGVLVGIAAGAVAGYGLETALDAGVGKAREGLSALPGALETIGKKLGAKRAREESVRVEPTPVTLGL